MRRLDILKRAGRNLRQAKGRTLLTSLAIAVGAFTLTLSLAAGEGARQYADNLLKNNIDPQALFIVKDESITSGSGGSSKLREYSPDATQGYRQGTTIMMMTKDDIAKLQARKDLKQVMPIYNLTPTYTQFEGNDRKYSAPVNYYDSTILSDPIAGRVPNLGEQINDDQVLLPEEFANDLGVLPQDLLGKKVSITFSRAAQSPTDEQIKQAFIRGGQTAVADLVRAETKIYEFTVSAVIKKSTMSLTSWPRLQISTRMAKEVSEFTEGNTPQAGQVIGVSALAIGKPDEVKQALARDYQYTVQTAKDAQNLLFTFVNILQGIVVGFALLALVASVFGIINTQYISVLERTSQIGLMKALGMSRRDIAKLFRYEAAWIGFLGGVLGVVLALSLGIIVNPIITRELDLGESKLLIFIGWQIAILIISLVAVAIIAGWFPARKAAKLDPIDALRTE